MYFFITALWLVVVGVNWWDEKRAASITIGSLGLIVQAGIWLFGFGYFGIAALGLLCLVGMFFSAEVFLHAGGR